MRWQICVTSILVSLAVGFFVLAADEKKEPDKKPAATEKTEPKEKLVPAGTVQGKLVRVEPAQKMICVEISIPYLNGKNIAQASKKMELMTGDEVAIRTANPPIELDEKGKPKKYTKKELDKLKGPDTKAWGYAAEFDSLKTGQTVLVYMSQKKPDKKSAPKKDKDLLDENKPFATKIHILLDPPK